jgi:hypothetical protein
MNDGAAQNTDKSLWEKVPGDYYSPKIAVTADGAIVIDVGGICYVRTVEQWHALAEAEFRKQRMTEVLERVTNDLLAMPHGKFMRELEKHKDGDIAKITREVLNKEEQ